MMTKQTCLVLAIAAAATTTHVASGFQAPLPVASTGPNRREMTRPLGPKSDRSKFPSSLSATPDALLPEILSAASSLPNSLLLAEEVPFWKNTDVLVFLAGVFPFAWATVEFWRRIAFGESFGTGSDSVVISIGEDDAPMDSRGRRVLGKGALITACVLFALAFGTLGIVLYSVATSSEVAPFVGEAAK